MPTKNAPARAHRIGAMGVVNFKPHNLETNGSQRSEAQVQCRKTCRVMQEVQYRKIRLHLRKPRAAQHAEAITKATHQC